MRIISGQFAGQMIVSPPEGVSRPVTDKVRSAIFSSLAQRTSGAAVLDLYAGSGALGLEALSRGAEHVVLVDQSDRVVQAIRQSVANLTVEAQVEVVKAKVERIVEEYVMLEKRFDLIFFDPPYKLFDIVVMKKIENLLQYSGLLIVSCSSKTHLPMLNGSLKLVQKKPYGDAQIGYYEKRA